MRRGSKAPMLMLSEWMIDVPDLSKPMSEISRLILRFNLLFKLSNLHVYQLIATNFG
ncbi:hypothetical protein HanPSC8_Chr15g0656021 [Helianthus annuus]|nr:hypothetical protein HanPSC8_Chr15g0656021 [Helianthus annuus]